MNAVELRRAIARAERLPSSSMTPEQAAALMPKLAVMLDELLALLLSKPPDARLGKLQAQLLVACADAALRVTRLAERYLQ